MANIEESFAIIEKGVEALKEKTKKTSQKVDDLEQSVDYNDQDISDLQRDVKGLQLDVDNLNMQPLYQEHYSRGCLLQKSPQSFFSHLVLIPYCNVTSWFAIALAEIRTRWILEKRRTASSLAKTILDRASVRILKQ